MIYLLFWLLLGNIAYSFAITLKMYEMGYKTGAYKTKIKRTSFLLGLSGILLGPLAFILISYDRQNLEKK